MVDMHPTTSVLAADDHPALSQGARGMCSAPRKGTLKSFKPAASKILSYQGNGPSCSSRDVSVFAV